MTLVKRIVLMLGLVKLVRYLADRLRGRLAPPQQPEDKLPGGCFMPGEVLLLAEYPAELKMEPEAIMARLDASLKKRLVLEPDRVVLVRSGERMLPVVCGAVPAMRQQPAELLALIAQLNQEFETAGKDADGFKMMLAAPNWMASGSGETIGSGGPGAHPVAALGADAAFTLPFELSPAARASARPQVVILDTAPGVPQLTRAYRRWVSRQQSPHPLLKQLLDVDGRFAIDTNLGTAPSGGAFEITYGEDNHLMGLVDYSLLKHPYVMSDHGLFVAGIVRSIAPEAQIHLIEVLNPYGVGCLESILRGLALIQERYDPQTPLVINCSFVLNIPQRGTQHRYEDTRSLTQDELLALTRLPELLWSAVLERNAVMVAAAGNDGMDGAHPEPRFPASHPEVVGVGALSHDSQPAPYTNRSDQPLGQGLATFGGSVRPASDNQPFWQADGSNGVLGVYTGGLPDGTPNASGWARWAGTSFAAPVIAGALAGRVGQGEQPAEALAALHVLASSESPVGARLQVAQD